MRGNRENFSICAVRNLNLGTGETRGGEQAAKVCEREHGTPREKCERPLRRVTLARFAQGTRLT